MDYLFLVLLSPSFGGVGEVQYFLHRMESPFPYYPFGGKYGTQCKALARLGGVADAYRIHVAVPCHSMYPWYFPFPYGGDGYIGRFSGHCALRIANCALESLRRPARSVQLMHMVHFGDTGLIFRVLAHYLRQPPVKCKQYIHPDAVVA